MQTTDDQYQITWLVRRVFRAMAQASSASLAATNITAADRAVMEFLYPARALSVPEIAARYQVSRQHIQKTVNALLALRLVSALENPRHKRSVLISLTKKGRELFKKIRKNDNKLISAAFSGIPAKDQLVTRKTLETLLEKLNRGDKK
jgi:DNA-binding MarR family transcriptional regulator